MEQRWWCRTQVGLVRRVHGRIGCGRQVPGGSACTISVCISPCVLWRSWTVSGEVVRRAEWGGFHDQEPRTSCVVTRACQAGRQDALRLCTSIVFFNCAARCRVSTPRGQPERVRARSEGGVAPFCRRHSRRCKTSESHQSMGVQDRLLATPTRVPTPLTFCSHSPLTLQDWPR